MRKNPCRLWRLICSRGEELLECSFLSRNCHVSHCRQVEVELLSVKQQKEPIFLIIDSRIFSFSFSFCKPKRILYRALSKSVYELFFLFSFFCLFVCLLCSFSVLGVVKRWMVMNAGETTFLRWPFHCTPVTAVFIVIGSIHLLFSNVLVFCFLPFHFSFFLVSCAS